MDKSWICPPRHKLSRWGLKTRSRFLRVLQGHHPKKKKGKEVTEVRKASIRVTILEKVGVAEAEENAGSGTSSTHPRGWTFNQMSLTLSRGFQGFTYGWGWILCEDLNPSFKGFRGDPRGFHNALKRSKKFINAFRKFVRSWGPFFVVRSENHIRKIVAFPDRINSKAIAEFECRICGPG